MSSVKFSYWSSPHITTKSGLKRASSALIAAKASRLRLRCSAAAAAPWSSAHSLRIAAGQLAGSFIAAGTRLPPSVLRKKMLMSASVNRKPE